MAALPTADRLASSNSVSPAQIGERPLVMLPRAQNPAFHDGVIAAWSAAGLMPAFVETAQPDIGHAQLAVASGAGVAVLPASSAERASMPGVRVLPLDPGPSCEIAIVSRRDASTTVAAFVSLAEHLAHGATKRRRLAIAA